MAEIDVRREGNDYRVEVREGSSRSVHRVSVSSEAFRRYAGGKGTPEELVRASFRFLLEREPKESILPRFDLPVIARYFPEYEREIPKHLPS